MALAITNGRVWDGTGSPPVDRATVLVEDERIVAVGPDLDPPAGTDRLDAAGGFVMPGLIDMHVHIALCGEDSLFAFLGTGVTAVRDLGADPDWLLPLREDLRRGTRLGPRVFAYGPLLDGDPPIFAGRAQGRHEGQSTGEIATIARPLKSVDEGVAAVHELIERGVDGIKLYAGLRPDMVGAMIAAVAGRVPVTGHLGRTSASEAVALGVDCLEHVHATCYQDVALPADRHSREGGNGAMSNYWSWLSTGWSRADLDAPYVEAFIDQLVAQRVALSPTTVLITGGMATSEAEDEPGQRYRPRFMVERQRERQEQMRHMREQARRAGQPMPEPGPVDPAVGAGARATELEFLRRVHQVGGIIVPSTDVGAAPQQVPGFALHRELALLVEAGIAASDVLQAATRQAAEVLRCGDLGTIEPGKAADLIVLDGDPLQDIHATRRIRTVVQRGIAHEPGELLERIRR